MKCFEIGEDGVEEGLLVTFSPNGPCIVLGGGSRQKDIMLGQGFARLFTEEDAKEDTETRVKWVDLVLQKPKEDPIPQENGETWLTTPTPEAAYLLIQERNPRDRRALVKLDFLRQPGTSSQATLTANSYSEAFNTAKDAVIRVFHDWPPIGVTVKECAYHERETKQNGEDIIEEILVMLLELLPGASFRILRSRDATIPEILIVWNGKTLRQIVPGKYQDRKNQV